MTNKEFNEKYKDYLEKGHYGMSINITELIEELDYWFSAHLILLPDFKYYQIKVKFGKSRFYFEADIDDNALRTIGILIEEKINTYL